MANEYIGREDAFAVLTEYYHHGAELQHLALREALSQVPAADVRPVILCRDCGHCERSLDNPNRTYNWCHENRRFVMLDDYCSFACEAEIEDQEQMTDDAANGDICGATGLPCCRCNPGACESRR